MGAVSLLPMASENLSFYVVWEIKNWFHFFCATGTIFDGNVSLPNHTTFYNLVFFYYLVELFPTCVTIPKASQKMAKSQGQYF